MSGPCGEQSSMENMLYAFSKLKIDGKEENEPIDAIIQDMEIIFNMDLPVKDEISSIDNK